jgi:hypothetical protein
LVSGYDGGPPATAEWNVRVSSCPLLLRALQELLVERGYVSDGEQLPPEAAAAGPGDFRGEVAGERDSPKRDLPYLVLGIALVPTILLTTLGISFIRQSRYTFRTVVRIGVEGASHEAGGEVRIILQLEAGAARDDGGIWRPTDHRGELAGLAGERRRLEQGVTELLQSMGVS